MVKCVGLLWGLPCYCYRKQGYPVTAIYSWITWAKRCFNADCVGRIPTAKFIAVYRWS